MNFLAGFPYVPHHGAASGGSWTAFFVLIAVMVIVAGALLALGNRAAASKPTVTPKPADADSRRKAA
jgi:hypothetical protein